MDDPKTKTFLIISFVLNFCLTFALIWAVGVLFFISMTRVDTAQSCVFPSSSDDMISLKETANAERAVSIEVNDAGFLNKGFQMYSSDNVIVTVFNSGQNSHSFVVSDLGLDTGLISAGETKSIKINGLEERDAMYNYTSGVGGDRANGFGGVIMVLK